MGRLTATNQTRPPILIPELPVWHNRPECDALAERIVRLKRLLEDAEGETKRRGEAKCNQLLNELERLYQAGLGTPYCCPNCRGERTAWEWWTSRRPVRQCVRHGWWSIELMLSLPSTPATPPSGTS